MGNPDVLWIPQRSNRQPPHDNRRREERLMKKNVIYSMRISRRIKDLLKKAADRERRTVASLLDKIIIDYLQREGYLHWQDLRQEQRSVERRKIMLPAIAMQDIAGEAGNYACLVHDISTGGVLLGFPKGSSFNISSRGELPRFQLALTIPDALESVQFDCAARHMRDTGEEIQMGCMFEPYPLQEQQTLHKYLVGQSGMAPLSPVSLS